MIIYKRFRWTFLCWLKSKILLFRYYNKESGNFLVEDAANVVDRHQTDTVPIIDDLNSYLAEFSTVNPSDIGVYKMIFCFL